MYVQLGISWKEFCLLVEKGYIIYESWVFIKEYVNLICVTLGR